MTKLELCQRLGKEAGISGCENGTLPTSTTSQAGEMLQLVNEIDSAYQSLQDSKRNWNFLRFSTIFSITMGTAEYSPSALSLPELKTWKQDSFRVYLNAIGLTDEQWLCFVPWSDFRDAYLFGSQSNNTGRPIYFSIKPDKSLYFYPKPDTTYTIAFEYWKRAQVLTANATEPLFPVDFHLILVAMGLMKHARREGAPELFSVGKEWHDDLYGQLKADQLPPMGTAGAIA